MAIDVSKLKLPSISEASTQLMELVADEAFDVGAVSDIVSQDPVLSGIVVKYANSPLYPLAIEVTNVRNAVSLLGQKNVQLAVVVASMRAFTKPSTHILETLWGHSQRISVIAKALARKRFLRLVDDIGLTALVHDMGAMVLAQNFPDEYTTILAEHEEDGVSICDLEVAKFGYHHDEVLKQIADELRLPKVACEAISQFHSDESLSDVDSTINKHIAILALAHALEERYFPDQELHESISEQRMEQLKSLLGFDDQQIDEVIKDAKEMIAG